MSGLLSFLISFLLLLGKPTITFANSKRDEEFLKTCPPSTCGSGSGSVPIRFPLRRLPAPAACGLPGLDVTCSGDDTLLSILPSLPPFKVTAVYYNYGWLTISLGSESNSSVCPLQALSSLVSQLQTPIFYPLSNNVTWLLCPSKSLPGPDPESIAGPIRSCSGGHAGDLVYVVYSYEPVDMLPRDCEALGAGGAIPDWFNDSRIDRTNCLAQSIDAFMQRREVTVEWLDYPANELCAQCEMDGMKCGFEAERNRSFCIGQHHSHRGLHVLLIAGASVCGFVILLSVSVILLYVFRLSAKEKEILLRVERFLATYKTTKPTRYTFSETKKITKRFRHKLGQGGFGSVYKGELPNGIPVAVKMLEKSKGDGEEFINEVATIGRIHHVNVVRLLGFCSEGGRHALIYEFMPNESLEKFIFSKEGKRSRELITMEKLLEIAISIARGIEYLHQGCDQRILHFDIKPHNILLDHNFNPKISDFGLAKLCSRDHSIVTMTAARGTMGYIAPEIYSRNFGSVSYKSDVYSFGMLLLEMVSGKRTVEPAIENQSGDYFPEWIYGRLIHAEDLGLTMQKGEEEDIAKKLVIVALWCIQWSPNERPTMTRVIQLLVGNLESLEIPPKPFVSSYQDMDTNIDDA